MADEKTRDLMNAEAAEATPTPATAEEKVDKHSLLGQWRAKAYDQKADRGVLQRLWTDYFESEKEILGRLMDDPYTIMMCAVVDGKIAGNGSISGIGEKRKIRHRCSMAIALYKDYWNLGIGTAMIGYMTELAGKIGWHQVDLEVVAENVQAQMLYKKCGFIETGRRHNALLFDDGTYHDEILMYKSLK